MRPTKSYHRLLYTASGLALVASLGLNLILTAQNDRLSMQVTDLRLRALLPAEGTTVPRFEASTLHGDRVTVGAATAGVQTQVLFVFNTRCPYCGEAVPVWNDIAHQFSSLGSVQVLGVSLDSVSDTQAFIAEREAAFPVVLMPDAVTRDLWDIQVVPAVLVLDSTGSVLHARSGALDSVSQDSLRIVAAGG